MGQKCHVSPSFNDIFIFIYLTNFSLLNEPINVTITLMTIYFKYIFIFNLSISIFKYINFKSFCFNVNSFYNVLIFNFFNAIYIVLVIYDLLVYKFNSFISLYIYFIFSEIIKVIS